MTSIKKSLDKAHIAIVYDWLDSNGGAERVLPVFKGMFPDADWYTSHASQEWLDRIPNLQTSFMQKLGSLTKSRKLMTPLYPLAFEQFDFSEYDIVISISSSFAKGVITKPTTLHVNYMLTPTRFLWISEKDYLKEARNILAKPIMKHLKKWDMIAAERPDKIVTISKTVQKRAKDIYKKNTTVIYPPFDIAYWEKLMRKQQNPFMDHPESYFLVVSRLQPYKKVDQVVRAFRKLKDQNLVIVGTGMQEKVLRSLASNNVTFLQNVSDAQLAYLYSHAKGLIMSQEEDFGYTALEAQVCTCPVIAYNKGGASETVKNGITGTLYAEQSVRGIRNAIEKFEPIAYTVQRHLQNKGPQEVEPFAQEKFIQQFTKYLNKNL